MAFIHSKRLLMTFIQGNVDPLVLWKVKVDIAFFYGGVECSIQIAWKDKKQLTWGITACKRPIHRVLGKYD